jgi:hypothetical protein
VQLGWQLADHFQVMFHYKVPVGGLFDFQDLYFDASTLARQLVRRKLKNVPRAINGLHSQHTLSVSSPMDPDFWKRNAETLIKIVRDQTNEIHFLRSENTKLQETINKNRKTKDDRQEAESISNPRSGEHTDQQPSN